MIGFSSLHTGWVELHRGWKWHPDGGLIGLGGSPGRGWLFLIFFGFIAGSEEINPRVYGC